MGVGNIAGIAIAVATGGPGAVFWMWVIATIGAASGFVESTLAQIYKAPRKGGGFVGGPAYYIGNVIGSSFFASVFAVLLAVTSSSTPSRPTPSASRCRPRLASTRR